VKRFLVLVGLVGAAVYLFGPLRIAPQDQVELALSAQPVSGPLHTSWGHTLQSLRQRPVSAQKVSKDIASPRSRSLKTEPDRLLVVGGSDGDMVAWARATLAAYRQPSKPSKPYAAPPEMWVIGQTNGWVQRDDTTDARGLPSYEYLAAIDDLSFGQSTAQVAESPPAQAAPTKTRPVVRVAVVSKPQDSTPAAKPVAHTRDDITVAGPYRPRGLFARARGDDGRRGRGLFGLFGGRKTERAGWSVGPAG